MKGQVSFFGSFVCANSFAKLYVKIAEGINVFYLILTGSSKMFTGNKNSPIHDTKIKIAKDYMFKEKTL